MFFYQSDLLNYSNEKRVSFTTLSEGRPYRYLAFLFWLDKLRKRQPTWSWPLESTAAGRTVNAGDHLS